MSWKPDLRSHVVREYRCATLVPERDGTQTAHLVVFWDGRQIRVLPDAQTTGILRSLVIRSALERFDDLTGDSVDLNDPVRALRRVLKAAGLNWEEPEPEDLLHLAVRTLRHRVGRDVVIIEAPGWPHLDRRTLQAAQYLMAVAGVNRDHCNALVAVGRSVYFWLYQVDAEGEFFLDEDNEPAMELHRVEIAA